jgi:glycosyltransferase involved in cell wall biosynthesis
MKYMIECMDRGKHISMKIGIDITNLENVESIAGEEIVTLSLVQGIYESGILSSFVFFALESVKQQMESSFKGIEVVPVKDKRNFYKKTLPRYVKKHKLAAVHYPHCHMNINLKMKAPAIVTLHGLFSKDIPLRQVKRLARKLRQADCIIAVSEFVRDELIKYSRKIEKGRIRVVSNSVFDIRTGLDIVFKKKYLLSVNSDIPGKNIITTLKAFNRIKEQLEHDLVIIGRINEKGKVYKYIKKQGLTARIIVTGHMNRDTLFGYYRNADLYVSTSRYEGFGLTPLEAMAAGIRIYSTMTPSLAGFPQFRKEEIIENPGDYRAIAKGILNMLNKPADVNFIQLRSRAVQEHYSLDKMMEGYKNIFGFYMGSSNEK